ncbi:MAG: hypothetical protein IJQ57_09110 [Synergistaceae bacterium]|nr:hypothetical protein [Synergistaceae bacterium]
MKKIFICFMLIMLNSFPAFCADINSIEREGLILRVQLNRLGSNGDPFEREEILRTIIDTCKGTEEGENAYWDLADLYLDGFRRTPPSARSWCPARSPTSQTCPAHRSDS